MKFDTVQIRLQFHFEIDQLKGTAYGSENLGQLPYLCYQFLWPPSSLCCMYSIRYDEFSPSKTSFKYTTSNSALRVQVQRRAKAMMATTAVHTAK